MKAERTNSWIHIFIIASKMSDKQSTADNTTRIFHHLRLFDFSYFANSSSFYSKETVCESASTFGILLHTYLIELDFIIFKSIIIK